MSDRTASRLDRGLYCNQLDWLLHCAESAGGARGTLGGVISAIERGGGSTYTDANAFHDAMLSRIGWAQGEGRNNGHANLTKAKRLTARWSQLTAPDRQLLHARYLGHLRAPDRVQLRFGELAGVVTLQWCERAEQRRRPDREAAIETLRDALCQVLQELEPLEASLARPVRPGSGWRERRFRAQSFRGLLLPLARPLRAARDGLLSRLSDADKPVSLDDDLEALRRACEAGEPKGLHAKADKAVRAAHEAWYATSDRERVRATEEAKAWAEGA